MAKKQSIEDQFFPVSTIPKLNQLSKPTENPEIIKKIIQGAVRAAYHRKLPDSYDLKYRKKDLPSMSETEEQITFITHLIESLQPRDTIEVTLAAQYIIAYIRGMEIGEGINNIANALRLFQFGHQVLEALNKYRTKGAQFINVQYNHNQGQINNYKIVTEEGDFQ